MAIEPRGLWIKQGGPSFEKPPCRPSGNGWRRTPDHLQPHSVRWVHDCQETRRLPAWPLTCTFIRSIQSNDLAVHKTAELPRRSGTRFARKQQNRRTAPAVLWKSSPNRSWHRRRVGLDRGRPAPVDRHGKPSRGVLNGAKRALDVTCTPRETGSGGGARSAGGEGGPAGRTVRINVGESYRG